MAQSDTVLTAGADGVKSFNDAMLSALNAAILERGDVGHGADYAEGMAAFFHRRPAQFKDG